VKRSWCLEKQNFKRGLEALGADMHEGVVPIVIIVLAKIVFAVQKLVPKFS
jgi:hypothetical protein